MDNSVQSSSIQPITHNTHKTQIIIAVVIVVLFLCLIFVGVFGFLFLSTRNSNANTQNQATNTNNANNVTLSQRVTGKAKVTDNGIDTPIYDDTVTSVDVGSSGGATSITLKNGVKAYFVLNNAPAFQDLNVELSEFKEMPTSSTHVPLYYDLGYGVNVSITGLHGALDTPAYLVFDFSKGAKLKEFQGMTKYHNFCDFSSETFNPEVCAELLNIPSDKTLNSKYIAVEPKYADDGRTPMFPGYTYYLGSDDLLVVRINDSTVVVPQPLTNELATDVLKSTFAGYSATYEYYEAYDIGRNLNIYIKDKDVLTEMLLKYFYPSEIKTLNAESYVTDLYNKAVSDKLIDAGGFSSPKSSEDQFLAGKTVIENIFTYGRFTSGDANSLTDAANLRRLYDSKIAGSAKFALTSLKSIEDSINQFTPQDDRYPYYLLEEGILIGKGKYVNINVQGETNDSESADRQAFEQEAQAAEQQLAAAVAAANSAFADASDVFQALTQWAQLVDLLGGNDAYRDQLAKSIEKAVQDMVNAAQSDDEVLKAAEACRQVLADSRCDDIAKKAKDIKLKLCQVDVQAKNLSNFAQQTELQKCEQ